MPPSSVPPSISPTISGCEWWRREWRTNAPTRCWKSCTATRCKATTSVVRSRPKSCCVGRSSRPGDCTASLEVSGRWRCGLHLMGRRAGHRVGAAMPHRLEDIQLAEVLIGEIDVAGLVARDAGRQIKLAGAATDVAAADEHQHLPLRIEDLHVAEGGVGHIDVAARVGGDALGTGELAGKAADLTERETEAPVGAEGLRAKIAAVDHVERAVGSGGGLHWQVEFAVAGAAAADGLDQGATLRVQHLHAVLIAFHSAYVYYVKALAVGADGDAGGALQVGVAAEIAVKTAVGAEHPYAPTAHIGNVKLIALRREAESDRFLQLARVFFAELKEAAAGDVEQQHRALRCVGDIDATLARRHAVGLDQAAHFVGVAGGELTPAREAGQLLDVFISAERAFVDEARLVGRRRVDRRDERGRRRTGARRQQQDAQRPQRPYLIWHVSHMRSARVRSSNFTSGLWTLWQVAHSTLPS